jgi:hypothetical protein
MVMSSKSELEVLKTLYEMLNGLTLAAERASEDNAYPDVARFLEKLSDLTLELEMRIKDLDPNWKPEWERSNLENQ